MLPPGLIPPAPQQAPGPPGLAGLLSGGGPPAPAGPSPFAAQQPQMGPPSTNPSAILPQLAPVLAQQEADLAEFKAQQAQAAAAAMAIAMSQDPNPIAAAAPSLPGEPTAPGMGQ